MLLLLLILCLLVSGMSCSPRETRALSPQCGRHVALYVTSLAQGDDWALHMMDASTKIPDGYFYGLYDQLGNFDECLAVDYEREVLGIKFQGQYCRVFVQIAPSSPISTILHNMTDQAKVVGVPFMWSSCLPSSCSIEDVEIFMEDYFGPSIGLTFSVVADANNCHVKGPSPPLGVGTIATLSLLALLVALVAVSTTLHLLGYLPRFSTVFSADVTARQLFSTKKERGGFPCLHGLRVGSILWVILGHRFGQEIYGSVSNLILIYITDVIRKPSDMTISNSLLAVDTFFLLSGLLMCHSFLRGMQRGSKFDVLKFYLYRYLRLTVPMGMVILMYVTVIPRLGGGPLWYNYVTWQSDACKANWWTNLLYINNYYLVDSRMCMGQTWYTAVDMQLAWLSPLVLLPLYYSPRAGKQLMAIITLLSCLIPLGITYVYGFSMSMIFVPFKSGVGKEGSMFDLLYIVTQCRATPYLCGIAMGYFLHEKEKVKIQISKYWVTVGWFITTAVCLTVIYSLAITYQRDYEYDRIGSAFYAGFHRLAWSAGLMWIIFACVNGYGGFIDSILSWRGFMPLSRLTYGAYLLHLLVMYVDGGDDRTPRYFSSFHAVYKFFGDLIPTFILATILFLLVEGPLLAALKIIFGKGEKTKVPKSVALTEDEETGK